jgi:hypothetical protein
VSSWWKVSVFALIKKTCINIFSYFEFRVCDNIYAEQPCLDKHVLKLMSGSPSISLPSDLETRFYPRNGSRIYEIRGLLPDGKCRFLIEMNKVNNTPSHRHKMYSMCSAMEVRCWQQLGQLSGWNWCRRMWSPRRISSMLRYFCGRRRWLFTTSASCSSWHQETSYH